MFKVNKRETLYLHTIHEPKLFRSWFRYRKLELHLEISTKHTGPSFKLHLGNASSETPVDWHICLFWMNFYGSFNWPGLGKFCAWVGHGHKRNLYLGFHAGQMWWNLWYDNDMGYDDYHRCDKRRKTWWWPFSWYRHKYRSWMCLREGCIELNPLDALWGNRWYTYIDKELVKAIINIDDFDGDNGYETVLKLQETHRARRSGPSFARGASYEGFYVDWTCDAGIPIRNHDWKGDNVYASAVRLPNDDITNWVKTAKGQIIEQIRKDRLHYTYRPNVEEAS